MLLYLNNSTFVDELGHVLVTEVRCARANGIPIVLIHENDEEQGGCAFERWARRTRAPK